ncbi:MAG: XdhC family protein [Desulfosarcinaceae bacterium]|nr:XdhC family protein [Desulfosarcinaceae bacterium]
MKDPITDAVCRLLDTETDFVIATIVSREGSAPRTAGAKMLISASASVGTIGGGRLEARMTKLARDLLVSGAPALRVPFDLTQEDTTAMDMICGGRGVVLLDRIDATAENRALFGRWRTLQDDPQGGWLVTHLAGTGTDVARVTRGIITADERICQGPPLAEGEWRDITAAARRARRLTILQREDGEVLIEAAHRPITVTFFGAGHVAQPSLHLAAMTGFRTVILDDRTAFANRERFPEADEVRVVTDFQRAFADLTVDSADYLVIFTRGHHHDRTVLAQALRTEAAYIGMIGSRRKRDATFAALAAEGFTQRDFERVHAPIGVSIGAETPAEIAVSIVAELIQKRSGWRA